MYYTWVDLLWHTRVNSSFYRQPLPTICRRLLPSIFSESETSNKSPLLVALIIMTGCWNCWSSLNCTSSTESWILNIQHLSWPDSRRSSRLTRGTNKAFDLTQITLMATLEAVLNYVHKLFFRFSFRCWSWCLWLIDHCISEHFWTMTFSTSFVKYFI